ncbi:MAG: peflin or Penta-EF hand domain-containing protein 1 [Paramarteilia canceri]
MGFDELLIGGGIGYLLSKEQQKKSEKKKQKNNQQHFQQQNYAYGGGIPQPLSEDQKSQKISEIIVNTIGGCNGSNCVLYKQRNVQSCTHSTAATAQHLPIIFSAVFAIYTNNRYTLSQEFCNKLMLKNSKNGLSMDCSTLKTILKSIEPHVKAFIQADVDGSRTVNFNELKAIFSSKGYNLSDEFYQSIITQYGSQPPMQ